MFSKLILSNLKQCNWVTFDSYGVVDYQSVFQAKGLLSEYQPKFNSAKAVYRERKKYIDDIDWNMLAVPPTGSYKVISK